MAGEYSDDQKSFADRITKGFNNATAAGDKGKTEEKSSPMKRRMMALSAPKED